MIRVLFVCHGNICRSPMAEFLFKDYVEKKNMSSQFVIESAATSTEEIGNGVHYGTKQILNTLNIDCSNKRARQIRLSDYQNYDYIIGMDEWNLYNLNNFFDDKDNKISLLMDFYPNHSTREISDPWYTHRFNDTYNDIMKCLPFLFDHITQKK